VTADDKVRLAYIRGLVITEGPPEGLGASHLTEALVEVAAVMLDLLADEDRSVRFECPEHRVQLHPQLENHRAVWWCPAGHAVAEIGHLRASTN